ncbi:MAG TPA: IS1634 family transposase [Candidatus Marinimicrobia bacterium]|nr:IS1634 family transposase [Candidatus Neomarinimicrobiota bacterium]
MAFLRAEKKKSGTYLRIVESYKDKRKSRHRTLHSLGKVEDYPPQQLEKIGKKLLELSGKKFEDLSGKDFEEMGRFNYGYALLIKKLFQEFDINTWARKVSRKHRVSFDWIAALKIMIAERLNAPSSKRAGYFHQEEYLGLSNQSIELQHFYRTLDILNENKEQLKAHLFKQHQNLFTARLDLVFYDVTTLYFDSQIEEEDSLRQRGFSKDGKAHKTQVVLGLLVDKLRNPISYHVYRGNTYEGQTMQDALKLLQSKYKIDNVVVVADSAMIDKANRDFIDQTDGLTYIIGDRIKNLPRQLSDYLLNRENHRQLSNGDDSYSYASYEWQGRRIICTYSERRAKKDRYEREKLIQKARKLLENPANLHQLRKRGAGRFIKESPKGSYQLDLEKMCGDEKWDGYKAIATTTELEAPQVLAKYRDLFEVEHAFRTLKSQLEIRPIFHWTNQRIEGHIAMCFLAFIFLNYVRNITGLQYQAIIKALDLMQVSQVKENASNSCFYLRSKVDEKQEIIINKLKMSIPGHTNSETTIKQYFI